MNKRESKVFSLCLLAWIISYNLWVILGVGVYYIGQALMIFGASWVIYFQNKGGQNKYSLIITELFFIFSINNLADEILFDPKSFEFNEYAAMFLATFLTIFRWRK